MKTVKINLYSFDELIEESKNRAINDAIIFLNNDLINFEHENGNIGSFLFGDIARRLPLNVIIVVVVGRLRMRNVV